MLFIIKQIVIFCRGVPIVIGTQDTRNFTEKAIKCYFIPS